MTIHRPHPITGPWPYTVSKAGADAHATTGRVPLTHRVPVPDSVVYDDPEGVVLYDDCERCAEHATHPLRSLDDDNLAALWVEMVRVEKDGPAYTAHYRNRTEAVACGHLYELALAVERTHPGVDPWAWPWQLRPGMDPAGHPTGLAGRLADATPNYDGYGGVV